MTINDLLNDEIQLQGDKVLVRVFNVTQQEITFEGKIFEIEHTDRVRDKLEVGYIYPENDDLIIEVYDYEEEE